MPRMSHHFVLKDNNNYYYRSLRLFELLGIARYETVRGIVFHMHGSFKDFDPDYTFEMNNQTGDIRFEKR